jgi:hypothetical protein
MMNVFRKYPEMAGCLHRTPRRDKRMERVLEVTTHPNLRGLKIVNGMKNSDFRLSISTGNSTNCESFRKGALYLSSMTDIIDGTNLVLHCSFRVLHWKFIERRGKTNNEVQYKAWMRRTPSAHY